MIAFMKYQLSFMLFILVSQFGSYNNPSDDELIAMIAKLNSVFAGTYNDGTINTDWKCQHTYSF